MASPSVGADAHADHESIAGVGDERGLSLEEKTIQRTRASTVRETLAVHYSPFPPYAFIVACATSFGDKLKRNAERPCAKLSREAGCEESTSGVLRRVPRK